MIPAQAASEPGPGAHSHSDPKVRAWSQATAAPSMYNMHDAGVMTAKKVMDARHPRSTQHTVSTQEAVTGNT